MGETVIVVDNQSDWKPHFPSLRVITAKEYLENSPTANHGALRVINLCRRFSYLSTGYYCSLLAEARSHKVVPTLRTIQDLSRKSIYSLDTEDIDKLANKVLGKLKTGIEPTAFEVTLFFGRTEATVLQEVGRQLYEYFKAPLLKVEFRRQGTWRIAAIKLLPINNLTAAEEALFIESLERFITKRYSPGRRSQNVAKYDLAILHNPDEQLKPSNGRALQNFIRAAKSVGINAELIQKSDYTRLAEYDALFIRETTAIDTYTYQFAKKADSEGMVVIDDPDSILKCTNKVYLAELLSKKRIPTPRTVIVGKDNMGLAEEKLEFPMIIKIPDGCFSRGIYKVADRHEFEAKAKKLFKESDLVLAQEFVPTEFDWRIGILNREPIYACQYFMSKKHWQIVDHSDSSKPKAGPSKTLPIPEVPEKVLKTAVQAAGLIGDSLYGVDLKETARGVVVIEINDNPNIDAGVEDLVAKDGLYRKIMEDFLRRLDGKRGEGAGGAQKQG